ncbi:MAG: hypothetical protein ACK44B_07420, partial [Flavobacteriales bacterium]
MNRSWILILTIALATSCNSLKNKKKEVVSTVSSSDKKELSTVDLSYLNKDIKAQEDFFMFSNGTWVKNNPVPPSESRWGSFNELDLNNKKKLVGILEVFKSNNGTVGSDSYILGRYYASFMDLETRNKLGFSPIKADIDKITGLRSKSDIVSIIADQHVQGINSLFSFGVGQDLKNVEMNISYCGQGGIGLPNRDYYTSENKKEILTKYKIHVKNIFQLLKYGEDDALKMAELVVQFETKMASAMMPPAELRIPEKTYNKMSREDAQKLFGKVDFENYLS